jgi:small nuclear ribonucleoprotein (snRNP)-like protein
MSFFRKRRPSRKRPGGQRKESQKLELPANSGRTGDEAAYLKSLVDSRKVVTVVFSNGDRLRGRVRYYDRDFLSVGPAERGPNVLLRKSSIRYISED